MISPRRSLIGAAAIACAATLAPAGAAAPKTMPPYRGLAVDRLPAGKIQHVVFEVTTTTTKDGGPPPAAERELNLTQRFETWNSRTGGRALVTLASGHFVSDEDGVDVALGGVIDEYTVSGSTCRRWLPATNVIVRWRCTGVNDRNTAILEHSETGLAHNFRHRRLSRYDIATVRSGGRRVVRFRASGSSPAQSDRKTVGPVPEDAPRFGASRHSRTARLLRRNLRLISDVSRQRTEIDGHVYVRRTAMRVLERELLPETPASRALMTMDHPGATIRRGRATHEKPL